MPRGQARARLSAIPVMRIQASGWLPGLRITLLRTFPRLCRSGYADSSPFTVAGQRRFQTELSNSPKALASGTRSIVWSAPAPQRRHSRHSSFQHMHHKSARKSISKNMLLCQWQKPGATLLWRSQRKRYTPQKRDVPCKQEEKTEKRTRAPTRVLLKTVVRRGGCA